jgi:hypothetical protein
MSRGNLTRQEVSAMFFYEPKLWPHLILPMKNPRERAPDWSGPRLAVAAPEEKGFLAVWFDRCMFDAPSAAPPVKVAVAELLADGWIVD